MKMFNSKSSTTKKPIIRSLINEFKLCAGSRSDDYCEQSISYRSMSEPIQVPTRDTKPLKSCLKKQPAQSNLHTHFASTLYDTAQSTPEKVRTGISTNRILSSTTVDSPVIAFSNATYEGSPVSNYSSSSSSSSSLATEYKTAECYRCLQSFYNLTSDESFSSDTTSSSDSTVSDVRYQDIYMVCVVPYVARGEQEMSIGFADRLKIMQISPDWCLVRNMATNICGYVPTGSLISLDQFLNDVDYLLQERKSLKRVL